MPREADDDGDACIDDITISMVGVDDQDCVFQFAGFCEAAIYLADMTVEVADGILVEFHIPFLFGIRRFDC